MLQVSSAVKGLGSLYSCHDYIYTKGTNSDMNTLNFLQRLHNSRIRNLGCS